MNWRHFFITNSWWGKFLGGFFGYLTGGPAGALFGILVGNFFDRGLANHLANPHWLYHTEKQQIIQDVFFESTFSVMGYLAKVDGRVTEQELTIAKQLMKEMRLTKDQEILAKQRFNEAKFSHFKLETVLIHLRNTCKDKPNLLRLFIDIQYRAAQVDGLSVAKITALNTVFTTLGFVPLYAQYRFYETFTDSTFQHQQGNDYQYHTNQTNKATHALTAAYALLSVNPNVNKQELKRAYRKAISQNHPDKLMAQGLPQSMIKIANDKTQQIVKAYELICASKGW